MFTVSLSAASGKTVTVAYTTADCARRHRLPPPDSIITPRAGTLTFAPGVTQQTITVHALPDLLVDPNETFRVRAERSDERHDRRRRRHKARSSTFRRPRSRICLCRHQQQRHQGAQRSRHRRRHGPRDARRQRRSRKPRPPATTAPTRWSVCSPAPTRSPRCNRASITDGRDTHLGVDSPTNDQFDGIVLVPSGAASGYNFGEQGVRSEFVSVFLNRRAFFASSIITGRFRTSDIDHESEPANGRRLGVGRRRLGWPADATWRCSTPAKAPPR